MSDLGFSRWRGANLKVVHTIFTIIQLSAEIHESPFCLLHDQTVICVWPRVTPPALSLRQEAELGVVTHSDTEC